MSALWIGLAAVVGYLVIGVVGALTWLPPERPDDPTERGASILASPPIGLLLLVVITGDGIGKCFGALVRLIGHLIPAPRVEPYSEEQQ